MAKSAANPAAIRGRDREFKILFISGYAEDAFVKSMPANRVPAEAVHIRSAYHSGARSNA